MKELCEKNLIKTWNLKKPFCFPDQSNIEWAADANWHRVWAHDGNHKDNQNKLRLRKKVDIRPTWTRTAWAVFKYCGTKTATLSLSVRS